MKRVRIVKDLPYERTRIKLDEFYFDTDIKVKELPNWLLKLAKPKSMVEGSCRVSGKVSDIIKKEKKNPEGR